MDAPAPPTLAHEMRVRVRYLEVDRMGYLWHGHYVAYFEQARTEWLRARGTTYRSLEEQGVLLVVVETGLTYVRPGAYDDDLLVRTRLTQARGPRLRFEYEVLRGSDLLATGFTVLASADASGRPCRPPPALAALLGADDSPSRRKATPPGDVQAPTPGGRA